MPFALTCECGARLEIDDKFAGQIINCPDCQRALQTPTATATGRRTSGLALASLILALVGAFTVVGTLAAVALGVAALLYISAKPDRLAGRGFALAGVALGVLLTCSTLFVISSVELFGLASMLREDSWAGKLQFDGPLEVKRIKEGFAMKRPSEKWGVYLPRDGFMGVNDRGVWDDLVLVLPSSDMTVLCFAAPATQMPIDACYDKVMRGLPHLDKVGLFHQNGQATRRAHLPSIKTAKPPKRDNISMIEAQFDWRQITESRTFLLRVYLRDDDDRMFVVIGSVPRGQFARLESKLREAMDGFQLLPREGRGDW
jgi:hypothetical protein